MPLLVTRVALQVQRVQILQARQLRDASIRNVGLAQVENLQLSEVARSGRC